MKKRNIIICSVIVLVVVAVIISINCFKISYTKEFTYLPRYKNMVVQKYEKPAKGQFGNAIYKVEGQNYNDFIPNYKKLLIKDGWTITKDGKLESVEAKKGSNIVKIHIVKTPKYLTVLIWSK